MGAKGSVSVVQLIMRDTMEEQLRTYVNSDKANTTPASCGVSSPDNAMPSPGRTTDGSSSPAAVAAAVLSDSAPSPSRKRPIQKSPWEGGKRRSRPRGVGSRRGTSGANSSASSQQEHAKVHFLLTSLRFSKEAVEGKGEGRVRNGRDEGGEGEGEMEVEEDGGNVQAEAGWKGKGKGRAPAIGGRGSSFYGDNSGVYGVNSGVAGKGETEGVVRRGVTFASRSVDDQQP